MDEKSVIEEGKRFLKESQFFKAFDSIKKVLKEFPDSIPLKQLFSRAAIRIEAFSEAIDALEPICDAPHPNDESYEETFGNLASAYKGVWRLSGQKEDAQKSRTAYLHAYKKTNKYWTGINAATMSWLIGEKNLLEKLAREVLEICRANLTCEEELYWVRATMGEACLLLNDMDGAIENYKEAFRIYHDPEPDKRDHDQIISALRQLRLLEENNFPLPDELFEILKPPTVVIFTGHMIDDANREKERFPIRLEKAVYREIEKKLDEIDAQIGYSGGACGADLLFVEAMLKRKAEVNIILPFEKDDFINTSVGKEWIDRFNNALNQANNIKYITEEKFLDDQVLFSFAGDIFQGYGKLRAQFLETTPYLLSVWDRRSPNIGGGTTYMVNRWMDKDRLKIIDLPEILKKESGEKAVAKNIKKATESKLQNSKADESPSNKREIRILLFADIVNYSKLDEEHFPDFIYKFLQGVAESLEQFSPGPEFIETWGDAIYAVMNNDRAIDMANYALILRDAVKKAKEKYPQLPKHLNVRIALHAGPVYIGKDPITKKDKYYGSQVNRAARLEPVTAPGNVYATEQFAAILTVEQGSNNQFFCRYVGDLSLPKEFGKQMAYLVSRRPDRKRS